mmetsp:Transcript_14925/g.26158  ORF Transcript_14925/g.26158 Transcript_14925/m.26158 type:complete len:186 (+) Transcript_14925:56-613(+)|eukprot:CAMPEP_0197627052 /NCGR_PEP_ID=MMETSP1338-20131121/5768_1 /TAXON_ID=43686 ORGANISM="Pelagodinium beii, Strain RCC1491" /NCGR_SAMPLE_ID=MMETSP1338 /ASSEMBLY_ACC=CAM_ASM_000754 /LENGTH=185 /DNA_ID=CAMNT_0043197665 /DNA_START=56 /DNA_END=613 /DNA_ORIENTATION=+
MAEAAPVVSSSTVSRMRKVMEPMPRLKASVVHGFGRGSKMLGFPTANMDVRWEAAEKLNEQEETILDFAKRCEPGIYYAWAQVADGPDRGVYKAAMSVGWNPTFTDVKAKTVEPWILHDYAEDFYGSELRLVVCGFVRPEAKFEKFDDLIVAIREDGEFCREALDESSLAELAHDAFFVPMETKP